MNTTVTLTEPQPAATEPAMPTRVWLLTNCPSPYQVELLGRVNRQPGVDLTVRFMQAAFRGDAPPEGLDEFPHHTLKWLGVPGRRDELKIHPGAVREAFAARHDVFVLSGLYTSPTFLMCALVLWLRRRGYVLWLERPSDADRPDLTLARRLLRAPFVLVRRVLLKVLLTKASHVLCMGTRAVEQYEEFGLDRGIASVVPYCCDTTRFEDANPQARDRLVNEHGLQEKTVFLFSGQLIRRKGLETALEAFRRLAEAHDDIAFVILGDGPLRNALETEYLESTHARVVFAGHQPQETLPSWFAAADVFVFPSRQDGWAVVINEACAAGLPIIASAQTGAAHDLVESGRNGFRLEWDDVDGFHAAMQTLLTDDAMRGRYGLASRELVQAFTVDNGAARFVEGIGKGRRS